MLFKLPIMILSNAPKFPLSIMPSCVPLCSKDSHINYALTALLEYIFQLAVTVLLEYIDLD